MYKDVTSYSRASKTRKPSVLECDANGIKFRVHKYLHCGEQWFLTCRDLNVEQYSLNTEDMEEAKNKAIIEVTKLLYEKVKEYQDAINYLENNEK
ncbi:hypothetical protein [Clostridium sp. AF32-12BH]|uniref:hypothetical protein n=1 Tax=Clostridium sp. AF32-12BH TaxID=2292006 RepID=UPI000E4AD9E4|nr:hypothetical protein [Clostridium sp. AF32-12BH]RHP46991.1 hypothetical protein DWZ40_08795 [Clostridium sp. AF32-12BH]